MDFFISPIQLLQSISLALELSAGGLSSHQWRVAMIADHVADKLDLTREERQTLVHVSLIHDIGAVASWEKVAGLRVGKSADLYAHAYAGYTLLKDSAAFHDMAPYIRYHHDRWDGNNISGLSGKQIPLLSRIICLSDNVAIQIDAQRFIFDQVPGILENIREGSGTYFQPELVDVFLRIAQSEGFWLDLINAYAFPEFFKRVGRYGDICYSLEDVMDIAEILATVVDWNDPFTGGHSRRVAVISEYLASQKGFCADEVKLMRIAGLLHDIGKLAVSRTILEKPDRLNSSEFYIIKQHPYYTYHILHNIEGLQDVAVWAAYHHETLDGKGYPFRIKGESLSLGSRIVAVADIFTALTEKRPYHATMERDAVRQIMQGMAQHGKIDGSLVAVLFHDPEKINYLIAHVFAIQKK